MKELHAELRDRIVSRRRSANGRRLEKPTTKFLEPATQPNKWGRGAPVIDVNDNLTAPEIPCGDRRNL